MVMSKALVWGRQQIVHVREFCIAVVRAQDANASCTGFSLRPVSLISGSARAVAKTHISVN
jgi:hypothetical protein